MMGFGFFDSVFSILFPLMFLLVVGMFVFVLIQGISTWNKNNHSPRLTVPARIVSKRYTVNHSGGTDHMMHSTFHTYYVTFQVDSGDRMELRVSGQEYGMLAEGDRGQLTFQGTRYLSFERM